MLNVGRVSLLGCRRVTLLARVLQLEVVEVLHARLRHACGFLVITLMGCVNTYVPNLSGDYVDGMCEYIRPKHANYSKPIRYLSTVG